MLLTVVGTGLIGGSFALGARTRNLFQEFVGVEPNADHADSAVRLGIVDEVAAEVPRDSDAVLIAGPSDTVADWVVRLADHPGVIFDVGSVKAAILESIHAALGRIPPRYVPCHPIAGREQSGPGAANEDLFADRLVIQTPGPDTDATALDQVVYWWRSLGSRIQTMDANAHDLMYALTSHLPHLLAFTYLQRVEPTHLEHAGGGFRDFSRIGGSDPDMWSAIFSLNKKSLLQAVSAFQKDLASIRDAISGNDVAEVRRLIATANARRHDYADE